MSPAIEWLKDTTFETLIKDDHMEFIESFLEK